MHEPSTLARLSILLLTLLVSVLGCGAKGGGGTSPPSTFDGPPPATGGGAFPPGAGGVTFPWPVFDGTVPDVPEAAAPSKTWYVDAVHGDDKNDGTTFATAKKTLSAAYLNGAVQAGDTILLGGGVYREYVAWSNGPSGKAGAPLTIGSYGRGTGAPILDGGVKPNTWTRTTSNGRTTVWQTPTAGLAEISAKQPVLGVYVNGPKGEFALKEVFHTILLSDSTPRGQLSQSFAPLPPVETGADIKDGSNKWYQDTAAGVVYADFGGTLGGDDPNTADISLLFDSENGGGGHRLLIYLGPGHDYFKFVGLTIRAGSWSGVYTVSNGHTFDHCDFKFNGGAALLFAQTSNAPGSGNVVTNSRVWMNILQNWPRFNNGYTSGGWPAAIDWSTQSNGLAEGNVVYLNGGEGLTVGNSDIADMPSVNNEVRHNIIFDNFSVNLYVNNVQNVRIEQNFVFQHPRDEGQTFDGLFEMSPSFNGDFGKRVTPNNLNLGDEPGSATDHQAHLANITVVNNIFAGGKFGFVDYDDGTSGPSHHGLKNCTIANNTWVLGAEPVPGQHSFVWMHAIDPALGPDQSANSILQNNVFATATPIDWFVRAADADGRGIDADYNVYSGPGTWANGPLGMMDFATWKTAHPNWDAHSVQADAQLTDPGEFNQTIAQKLVYDWSKAAPKAGSPALGSGKTGLAAVTTDFTGAARPAGSPDIGAIAAK
ncbi:MAG TPA: right-handed parallel beta-helix repeat-containing protein [Polyangia bacterium]|nr:right-handed parallel beta-helix repeat-containing protein [Polyangia bacterium]